MYEKSSCSFIMCSACNRSIAQKIRSTGGMVMDFTAFDTQKIKKYTEQAKKEWGETPEYKEFEEKTAHKTEKEVKDMSSQLMDIVAAFGGMQSKDPAPLQNLP